MQPMTADLSTVASDPFSLKEWVMTQRKFEVPA
jgi:hypothetical protein